MFARTERLLLRPGWIEDAAALAQLITGDSTLVDLLPGHWLTDAEDTARNRIQHQHESISPELLILLRTNDAPLVIGGIDIRSIEKPESELVFWIAPAYRGRGFATEAGHAMLNMASHALGIRRLVAVAEMKNNAAARVLGKLGFQAAGRTMRRIADRDALIPATRYSRTLVGNPGTVTPSLAA